MFEGSVRKSGARVRVTAQQEESRRLVQEYLQLELDHTVENIRGRLPARNPPPVEVFIDALCDAGLPR